MVGLLVESRGPAAAIGDFCEIRHASGRRDPHAGDRLPRRPGALDAARGDRRPAAGRPVVARREEARVAWARPARPRARRLRRADGRRRRRSTATDAYDLLRAPPGNPLEREHITEPLVTGIRAIDSLLPCGKGQRIGIFGGSGVGKSTLLGSMSPRQLGRRQRDRADRRAQPRGARISSSTNWARRAWRGRWWWCATSDRPAPLRVRACFVATGRRRVFPRPGRETCCW